MSADRFEGACLCGGVRFAWSAPSKWCAHCHCSMCQRAHGAAFVTWIGVPDDLFRLEEGEMLLEWHESSPGAQRGFCLCCGSSLFFKSTRWPGEIHVTRASVPGPIDLDPQAHVFAATRVDWIHLADELPVKD